MEPPRKRARCSFSGEKSFTAPAEVRPARRATASDPSQRDVRYPYSQSLFAHHGCVNALACSKLDGRWLASGGDDKRVLLWDTFDDLTKLRPKASFHGPRANIFSCDMSSDGRTIFAGGLCNTIFQWDLDSPGTPQKRFEVHDASVRGLSCHPTEPHTLITASEDGTVVAFDTRQSEANPILAERSEYVDALFHPTSEHLFAAATSKTMHLFDRRSIRLAEEPAKRAMQKYTSSMIRGTGFRLARPEISSLAFDPSGNLLAAMLSRWYPTIWSLDQEYPIAVLQSTHSETEGYRDSVTVKHGAFSSPNHSDSLYFAAGSEDFSIYLWKLPPELREARREEDFVSWRSSNVPKESQAWAHCSSATGTRSTPTSIFSPAARLYGHRSVPNSVVFHPTLPLVFTAGVEKVVRMHSLYPVGEPDVKPTPPSVRHRWLDGPLPSVLGFGDFGESDSDDYEDEGVERAEGRHSPSGRNGRTEQQRQAEDTRTLRMFDALLVQEGDKDYGERVWATSTSDEDTDSEEEE